MADHLRLGTPQLETYTYDRCIAEKLEIQCAELLEQTEVEICLSWDPEANSQVPQSTTHTTLRGANPRGFTIMDPQVQSNFPTGLSDIESNRCKQQAAMEQYFLLRKAGHQTPSSRQVASSSN